VFISLLSDNPQRYFTVLGIVVVSIVLHELGHALAATWEGDPTPKVRGHLTWNPIVHMGWMSIGIAAVIGIAWGATPVRPANFRHRRWGEVIVSFAGPAVNLTLALVSALVLNLVLRGEATPFLKEFWWTATVYNLALFLLNMIPVPPLDGFTIAHCSFDMGRLGQLLRTSQPWPLLFVFVLLGDGFWSVVYDSANALALVWHTILPGGA